MAALLERAVRGGEIPPLDVEYAAGAILAPLNIDLYLSSVTNLVCNPSV